MSEQPGRYQRSFGGLVGALIVSLAVVLLFVGFRALFRVPPSDPVQAIDYVSAAKYAGQRLSFPVAAPQQLPPGWIATSANSATAPLPHWHLGMLTQDRKYVGVEESTQPPDELVKAAIDPSATRGKDVSAGGVTWQRWTGPNDNVAYVRQSQGYTLLLVTTAGDDTLQILISTLPGSVLG